MTAEDFVNATPHTVIVGHDLCAQPSGHVAHLVSSSSARKDYSRLLGVPSVGARVHDRVEGLPRLLPEQVLIVSHEVGEFIHHCPGTVPEYIWVVSPDMSPECAILDDAGRVVGTERLIVWQELDEISLDLESYYQFEGADINRILGLAD